MEGFRTVHEHVELTSSRTFSCVVQLGWNIEVVSSLHCLVRRIVGGHDQRTAHQDQVLATIVPVLWELCTRGEAVHDVVRSSLHVPPQIHELAPLWRSVCTGLVLCG